MTAYKSSIMPDFCSRSYPYHYTTAINLLMKMGVSTDRIFILSAGEYENYKGEIRSQDPLPGKPLEKNTRITLKIGFSSAVDYMPYQFFYGLQGLRESGGGWEERAREMMAPFESAAVKNEAGARFQKLKYEYGILDIEHLTRVLRLFNFEPNEYCNDIHDILFWVSIIPFFHHWAGNPECVEKILGFIFDYKFTIIENSALRHEIPEHLQYRLGSKSGLLARETVIGREFTERDSAYDLIIEGVKMHQTSDFLPGKPIRKKLDWVLGFCMPNNLECKIRIKVDKEPSHIGGEGKKCYLGYSAFA